MEQESYTLRGGKRAVLYARVSSREQEREGFSIEAQRKSLRTYAEEHRLQIVREFVDVETAKQTGRTGFGEMLKFLRRRRMAVLVEKTDRLYRNLKDWVMLDELDVEIHFVKENFVLSKESRSSEKLVHGIKVLMAKNYIDNLSEETKKGQREKASQGGWPGRAPIGYRNVVGPDCKKRIESDAETASLVKQVFEWYATGNYSLRDVTKMAQEAGLRFRQSGRPINRAAVHRMLCHRIYTGDFEWNGKVFRGVHEPLISHELWSKVQAILNRRFEKRHRKTKHDFLFSGLIECGHCGCAMVAEIKKGKYIYYHCTGSKGKGDGRRARQKMFAFPPCQEL